MVRSQINVGCLAEEHVVTTWENTEDIEVVLEDNAIEEDIEVVLNPNADLFQVSQSLSSCIIEDIKHLQRTCTTRDMSEEMERRDEVDDDDLSDRSPTRAFNGSNNKSYASSTSSPTATKGEVEIVFEPSCNPLQQKSLLEQEDPIQEFSQNNGMDNSHPRKGPIQFRFGNFVYQVVSRQGATVHPNAQSLVSSLEVDETQNENDNDNNSKTTTTPVALNYGQMMQVDQVAQISSLDTKESELQNAGAAAKSTSLRKSTEIVRLAHGEGWVAAEENGKALLQPLPVWTGLWCWFVHYNCTNGLVITKHPTNPTTLCDPNDKDSILLPLQKVYCDAKVVDCISGKTFYRLQTKSCLRSSEPKVEAVIEQATQWNGWICDSTTQNEPTLLAEE